jgi:multidrug efflux pump subunit AcrB
MNGFNLSRWALEHRSFVWYLMLLFVVSGVWSYLRLGRDEDPPFTVKTMIVATAWPGAAIDETILQVTDRIEKKLQETPSLDYLKSYTQSGQSTILVVLKESTPPAIVPDVWDKVRKKVDDIRTTLPQGIQGPFFNDGFGDTVAARIYPLELGPPVGWPLQYRVSGADPQRIRDLAYAVADVVGSNPWTRKIGFDWSEPIKAVHVNVDQDKARRLGISSEALAQAIDATTRGLVITQLRDYVYLVDVIARSGVNERASLDTLRELQLPLPGGRNLPLLDVASLEYTLEQPLIWRRDRLPTITVQADLAPGIEAKTVTAQLASKIAAFARTLPAGYRIETGGTADASAKGLGSVIAVVPIMIVLMATILMAQLQSFQRLFLVVSVAPLGLIGVVAALLPSHMPLGFIAMLGVIALTGMIIRNSVILIDQIGRNIATGEAPWNAVVNAASHRLRPILLTAAAAMLGMLPIAGEVFWGPMAYAIIGGLASATLLTLLFLPALYAAWFRIAETPTTAITVEASAAAK